MTASLGQNEELSNNLAAAGRAGVDCFPVDWGPGAGRRRQGATSQQRDSSSPKFLAVFKTTPLFPSAEVKFGWEAVSQSVVFDQYRQPSVLRFMKPCFCIDVMNSKDTEINAPFPFHTFSI